MKEFKELAFQGWLISLFAGQILGLILKSDDNFNLGWGWIFIPVYLLVFTFIIWLAIKHNEYGR